MTRRLTDRGEERRRQLLDFATRRFAEKGYHPTSVAEIVEGLGVGKGVFYWYFASKEELFRAILRDAQLDLRRHQQHAIAGLDDPLARIAEGIRESVRWTAEHQALATLVAFASTDDRFARAVRKGQEVAVADARLHVEAAMDAGAIPVGDPSMLAWAMIGVAGELTRTFLAGPAGSARAGEAAHPVDEVAEVAVQFCLGGLLGVRAPRS